MFGLKYEQEQPRDGTFWVEGGQGPKHGGGNSMVHLGLRCGQSMRRSQGQKQLTLEGPY